MRHFSEMVDEFQASKWADSSAKGGKFIEAVMKALWVRAGEVVPVGKDFKLGNLISQIENKTGAPDTVRLTIPRACRFAYEIASNRGARHDAGEIDANEMDARAVIGLCAWILAEMVRFSQKGSDLVEAQRVVDSVMQRRFPYAEEIDGRVYADVGESAFEVALLILYSIHPKRMTRDALLANLVRHPFKKKNAATALNRIKGFIDDDGSNNLRLRNTGLRKAEEVLSKRS